MSKQRSTRGLSQTGECRARSFGIGYAVSVSLAAFAVLTAVPGAAQSTSGASAEAAPSLFDAVVACRAIAEPSERLACFDRSVPALDEARRGRQIVVMDREEVREARRGLFGLLLPAGRIFGGGDDDSSTGENIDRIETTIDRANRGADGKWIFVLADGARWQQIDVRRINDPRQGTTIAIRRAAMGSFLANVGGQTAIRVRRVN